MIAKFCVNTFCSGRDGKNVWLKYLCIVYYTLYAYNSRQNSCGPYKYSNVSYERREDREKCSALQASLVFTTLVRWNYALYLWIINFRLVYHDIAAKINFLPRNCREKQLFYREITAKFAILWFRGTAKFGVNYRDKYRPLPWYKRVRRRGMVVKTTKVSQHFRVSSPEWSDSWCRKNVTYQGGFCYQTDLI